MRKTRVVNLSLPLDIYHSLETLAEQRRVSKSEILRRALQQYLTSEERWQRIRVWGGETAQRLGIRDETDVDRILHAFRQEKGGNR